MPGEVIPLAKVCFGDSVCFDAGACVDKEVVIVENNRGRCQQPRRQQERQMNSDVFVCSRITTAKRRVLICIPMHSAIARADLCNSCNARAVLSSPGCDRLCFPYGNPSLTLKLSRRRQPIGGGDGNSESCSTTKRSRLSRRTSRFEEKIPVPRASPPHYLTHSLPHCLRRGLTPQLSPLTFLSIEPETLPFRHSSRSG